MVRGGCWVLGAVWDREKVQMPEDCENNHDKCEEVRALKFEVVQGNTTQLDTSCSAARSDQGSLSGC